MSIVLFGTLLVVGCMDFHSFPIIVKNNLKICLTHIEDIMA